MQESAQMYLETIFVLRERQFEVRSIDIAKEMSFSKASVSIALKSLKEKGFVEIGTSGFIHLTGAGEKIARGVYERHVVIERALIGLGVPPEIAKEDACKIEHDISDVSFERLKAHLESRKA